MTPKEKAEQIFYKMQLDWACDSCHNDWAKECALIAVEFSKEFITGDLSEKFDKFLYLQEVKEEILKL